MLVQCIVIICVLYNVCDMAGQCIILYVYMCVVYIMECVAMCGVTL